MKNEYRKKAEEKLNYPFLLIKLGSFLYNLGNDAAFTIKEDETNSRVCLFSDKIFTTIKDDEVMKEYFKNKYKTVNKALKLLRN